MTLAPEVGQSLGWDFIETVPSQIEPHHIPTKQGKNEHQGPAQ
jgi:hypothetical protein